MYNNDNILGYFNEDFVNILNKTENYKMPNTIYPDWCPDCNHKEHVGEKSSKIINNFDLMSEFSYKLNNYGFRSNDFLSNDANSNFLFGGCSNSFAQGLPFNFSWINHFNNEFKKNKINSVAVPGSSADIIIHNVFTYIKKIGNPEGVVIIFPRMDRLVEKENYTFKDIGFETSMLVCRSNITWEQNLIRRFLLDIMLLEEICYLRGIKLIWSTWDENLEIYIKKHISKYVKNFYSMNDFMIDPNGANEIADIEYSSSKYWLESRDGHIAGLEHFIWAQSMIKGWKEKYEEYNKSI